MDGWDDDDLQIDDLDDLGLEQTEQPPVEEPKAEVKKDAAFEMDFFESLAAGRANQAPAPKLELDDLFASVAPPKPQAPPVQEQPKSIPAQPAPTENIVGSLFSFFNNQVVTRATTAVTEGISQTVATVVNETASAPPSAPKPKVAQYAFEDTSNASDMEKQVMQHLIQENRMLKQQLNTTSEELTRSRRNLENCKEYTEHEYNQLIEKKNTEIEGMSREVSHLQKLQLNDEEANFAEFDPQQEFEEIAQLFDMYRQDLAGSDISHLYTACKYTQDRTQLLNFKAKLFQSIAQRAIRNQEFLVKSNKRRNKGVPNENKGDNVKIFIENKRLIQSNQGLQGQLEQLKATLERRTDGWQAKEKKQVEKLKVQHLKLKEVLETVQVLRNDQMMLRTFSSELKQHIGKRDTIGNVVQTAKSFAKQKDKDVEEARKAVYDKNKHIGDLFMKQQEQEQEFTKQLAQIKQAHETKAQDEVASITYAKNREIGDLFNKQNALNMEIQELTQQMQLYQEDAEIAQMIKDENQHLKKAVLEVTKENDELQAQQQQQISSKLQAHVLENSTKATLEQRLESLIKSKSDQQIEHTANLEDHKLQFQVDLSSKQAEIQDLNDLIEIKDQDFHQIEEEIDQYQQDLQEKEQYIEALNQELQEKNMQMDMLKDVLEKATTSEKKSCNCQMVPDLQIEIVSLKQKCEMFEGKIENLKENLLKKEDELKNMVSENEQAKQLIEQIQQHEENPAGDIGTKEPHEAKEEIQGWDDGDLSMDPFEFQHHGIPLINKKNKVALEEPESEITEEEDKVEEVKSNLDLNPWGVEDEILSSDINNIQEINKQNEDLDRELFESNPYHELLNPQKEKEDVPLKQRVKNKSYQIKPEFNMEVVGQNNEPSSTNQNALHNQRPDLLDYKSPTKVQSKLSSCSELEDEFQHMHSAMSPSQLTKLIYQAQTDNQEEQRNVDQYFKNLKESKIQAREKEVKELDAELLKGQDEFEQKQQDKISNDKKNGSSQDGDGQIELDADDLKKLHEDVDLMDDEVFAAQYDKAAKGKLINQHLTIPKQPIKVKPVIPQLKTKDINVDYLIAQSDVECSPQLPVQKDLLTPATFDYEEEEKDHVEEKQDESEQQENNSKYQYEMSDDKAISRMETPSNMGNIVQYEDGLPAYVNEAAISNYGSTRGPRPAAKGLQLQLNLDKDSQADSDNVPIGRQKERTLPETARAIHIPLNFDHQDGKTLFNGLEIKSGPSTSQWRKHTRVMSLNNANYVNLSASPGYIMEAPSESLEEIGDDYKDSEFYSPLKQSKIDQNSEFMQNTPRSSSIKMSRAHADAVNGIQAEKLTAKMNKLLYSSSLNIQNPIEEEDLEVIGEITPEKQPLRDSAQAENAELRPIYTSEQVIPLPLALEMPNDIQQDNYVTRISSTVEEEQAKNSQLMSKMTDLTNELKHVKEEAMPELPELDIDELMKDMDTEEDHNAFVTPQKQAAEHKAPVHALSIIDMLQEQSSGTKPKAVPVMIDFDDLIKGAAQAEKPAPDVGNDAWADEDDIDLEMEKELNTSNNEPERVEAEAINIDDFVNQVDQNPGVIDDSDDKEQNVNDLFKDLNVVNDHPPANARYAEPQKSQAGGSKPFQMPALDLDMATLALDQVPQTAPLHQEQASNIQELPQSNEVANVGWDDQEDELDLGELDMPDEQDEPITDMKPTPTANQETLGWDEDEPLDIDGVLDQPAADAGEPIDLNLKENEESRAKGPGDSEEDTALAPVDEINGENQESTHADEQAKEARNTQEENIGWEEEAPIMIAEEPVPELDLVDEPESKSEKSEQQVETTQQQQQDQHSASIASGKSQGGDEGTQQVDVANDMQGHDQEVHVPQKTMQDWDEDEPLDIDEMLDNDDQQPHESSLLDPLADHELTHISNSVPALLDREDMLDGEAMFAEDESEYEQSDAGEDVDLYAQRVTAQQDQHSPPVQPVEVLEEVVAQEEDVQARPSGEQAEAAKQGGEQHDQLSDIIEVDDSGWAEELEAASELSKMTKKDTFIQFFDQEQSEATIPISKGRTSDPESPSVTLKGTFITKSDALIGREAADIKVGDQSDLSNNEQNENIEVRLQEHQSQSTPISSVEVLDVQGDAPDVMTTKPGFTLLKKTGPSQPLAVQTLEEDEQELKGAAGLGWEEDVLLDVDLEEMAGEKETNAKHEGKDVHGNAENEPEQTAPTLNELLTSPRIPLPTELEVVPEHGWEDEDVLDLADLEEHEDLRAPVVDKQQTLQKVEPVQELEEEQKAVQTPKEEPKPEVKQEVIVEVKEVQDSTKNKSNLMNSQSLLINAGLEDDVPLDLDDLGGKPEEPKEDETTAAKQEQPATTGWEDDHLDLDDIFADSVPVPSQPVAAPSSTAQPLEAAEPQSTPAAAASGWDDDDDIAADFL